jgi:hypothetical protein
MEEEWENQPEGGDDEDENEQQQHQQQEGFEEDEEEVEEEEEEEDDILDMGDDRPTYKEAAESLLMRFCPHDSSMLYPSVRNSLPNGFLKKEKLRGCIK